MFTVSSLTSKSKDDPVSYWELSAKNPSFHYYSYGASTTLAFTCVCLVSSWRSTGLLQVVLEASLTEIILIVNVANSVALQASETSPDSK